MSGERDNKFYEKGGRKYDHSKEYGPTRAELQRDTDYGLVRITSTQDFMYPQRHKNAIRDFIIERGEGLIVHEDGKVSIYDLSDFSPRELQDLLTLIQTEKVAGIYLAPDDYKMNVIFNDQAKVDHVELNEFVSSTEATIANGDDNLQIVVTVSAVFANTPEKVFEAYAPFNLE